MAAHDPVALAEIDLYSDLMIAAAATPFDRLPTDRIDEVLRVDGDGSEEPAPSPDDRRVPPRVPPQQLRS